MGFLKHCSQLIIKEDQHAIWLFCIFYQSISIYMPGYQLLNTIMLNTRCSCKVIQVIKFITI